MDSARLSPLPRFSVILRSRNDAAIIERTLRGIFLQSLAPLEIICLDNASTDGTREILERHGDSLSILDIPEGDYVPGKVLNQGVQKARGDIIVFLNSDAIPLHPDCFARLLRELSPDEATYARQLPRPDARQAVRYDYNLCFPETLPATGQSPCGKNFFSIVCAAAHKALLLEHPFPEHVQYSEDTIWANHISAHGHRIRYCPEAKVEHSHNYSFTEAVKRFTNEGKAEAIESPGLMALLVTLTLSPARTAVSILREIISMQGGGRTSLTGEIVYSIKLRTAQKILKPVAMTRSVLSIYINHCGYPRRRSAGNISPAHRKRRKDDLAN